MVTGNLKNLLAFLALSLLSDALLLTRVCNLPNHPTPDQSAAGHRAPLINTFTPCPQLDALLPPAFQRSPLYLAGKHPTLRLLRRDSSPEFFYAMTCSLPL